MAQRQPFLAELQGERRHLGAAPIGQRDVMEAAARGKMRVIEQIPGLGDAGIGQAGAGAHFLKLCDIAPDQQGLHQRDQRFPPRIASGSRRMRM